MVIRMRTDKRVVSGGYPDTNEGGTKRYSGTGKQVEGEGRYR